MTFDHVTTSTVYLLFLALLVALHQGHGVTGEQLSWNKYDNAPHQGPHRSNDFPRQFVDQGREPSTSHVYTPDNLPAHLPDKFSLRITVNNTDHILDLTRNSHLVSSSFTTSFVTERGVFTRHQSQTKDHCYYLGRARGIENSHVRLSTCNGLEGYIDLPGNFLVLGSPGEDGHVTGEGDHVMFRPSDLKPASTCTNRGENIGNLGNLRPLTSGSGEGGIPHRKKRSVANETLFVELMLVVDNARWKQFTNQSEMESRFKQIVNYMDGFYVKLGIRVVLVHIEVWESADPIPASNIAQEVLESFLTYRLERIQQDNKTSPWRWSDNVQLIYGGDFNDSTIGLAIVGSMCSARSGGVNQDHRGTLHTAATIAHEMGHNFGMAHDTDSCNCTEGAHCLMEATSRLDGGNKDWSSCSKEYLRQNLELGAGSCLTNVPDHLYFGPECGNQIVEEGEECDCGSADTCTSACCNATTCQLLPHAECDSGLCCVSCRLATAATRCRSNPDNECELPEFCTGDSNNCPTNVYVEDGTKCNNDTATCYDGVCLTRDLQCKNIWGPDASNGNLYCYVFVNQLGDANGNCGRDASGNFVRCSVEHATCGKLQCTGGGEYPRVARDQAFHRNALLHNGVVYLCKTIRSTFSNSSDDDVSDAGMVRDGTSCGGDGKVCVNGACTTVESSTCSESCNDNGICNNMGNCHCVDGWSPPYCNTSGHGGSVDSGPTHVTRLSDSTTTAVSDVTETITTEAVTTDEAAATSEDFPQTTFAPPPEGSSIAEFFEKVPWYMFVAAAVILAAIVVSITVGCVQCVRGSKLKKELKKRRRMYDESGQETNPDHSNLHQLTSYTISYSLDGHVTDRRPSHQTSIDSAEHEAGSLPSVSSTNHLVPTSRKAGIINPSFQVHYKSKQRHMTSPPKQAMMPPNRRMTSPPNLRMTSSNQHTTSPDYQNFYRLSLVERPKPAPRRVELLI